jgi:hypothetical protein
MLWGLVLSASAGGAYTFYKEASVGEAMTSSGQAFVGLLTAEQKQTCVLDYAAPQRFDWHFIPKDYRKGLQLKHMDEAQQKAALNLLQTALSEVGYGKATKIMEVEKLLHELEGGKGRNIRDPQRYYFTLFGTPGPDTKWGLSVEGHHLSLNFVVEKGQVISSTPQFFAANPALVKNENNAGIAVGTRILKDEELLAFELVNSLTDEQKKKAILDPVAPKEIREAGSAQPVQAAPEGIPFNELTMEQKKIANKLINAYCAAMPASVAEQRLAAIQEAGRRQIHFAWAGATEPGIGHYYRMQGPTFVIEFVNTQPDSAGNPANHIHAVWRDYRGDFAVSATAK